jgi:hypothetical protein
MTLLPTLSSYDPIIASEGSLDPLGMAALADRLARAIAPGVTERQDHPRFLTAMAVGSIICRDFAPDTVAKDGESEPWQVFEWYVVEGLVRRCESQQVRGLRGRDKARQAIDRGLPLSAARYLKVPTVFGFHGVFRVLADNLGMRNGDLGTFGQRLVLAWEKEQGLEGFFGGNSGPGARWRKILFEAVRDGVEAGEVARRSTAWEGWDFMARHLLPLQPGRSEGKVIAEALLDQTAPLRREIIAFLSSKEGARAWEGDQSERLFHEALRRRASQKLSDLLGAVRAYESFARAMDDAFSDCLKIMTRMRTRVTIDDLAADKQVRQAAIMLAKLTPAAVGAIESYDTGLATAFAEEFDTFNGRSRPADFVEALLERHRQVQRRKPPEGKAPWFESDGTGCVVRAAYRNEEGGRHDGSYVHGYRTQPLWAFIKDLRLR